MASHPSPFYRQRQSNKTLDPTGQTAKFLYTILKQLDLKNIDWNEVASNLGITNGHAARMRWSRFRAQIEGLDNSYSRKGGRKKDGEKKRKKDDEDTNNGRKVARVQETREAEKTKLEAGSSYEMEDWLEGRTESNGDGSAGFKKEGTERMSFIDGIKIHHPTVSTFTIPRSNGSSTRNSQGSTVIGGHTPARLHPPYADRSIIPEHKSQQLFGVSSASHEPHGWPQQHHHLAYAQHLHRSNATPSSYSPTSYFYPNQHIYANAYAHQPQQRYTYGAPMVLSQFQHQPYMYAHMNAQTTSNTTAGSAHATVDHRIQSQNRPSLHCSPTTNGTAAIVAPAQKQIQPSASVLDTSIVPMQDQACELASQTSYPWLCSETSLSQFVSQLNNPTELGTSTNEQQPPSEASSERNHQSINASNFGSNMANPTPQALGDLSGSSQAMRAQLDGTDLGASAQSTEIPKLHAIEDTLEQVQDHLDRAMGIKTEPGT